MVFSKYGYDAATTKLIATKSGVNESLIMRYFGGKEGLMLEILRRHFEQSRITPLPYPPQESLMDEVIKYIKYSYENAKKNMAIFRIMVLRASVDTNIRKKVQALIPAEGDIKFKERIDLLKSKKKIPQSLDHKFLALIGFQNISTIFISGVLFDETAQNEIQHSMEKLAEHTISGLLKSEK